MSKKQGQSSKLLEPGSFNAHKNVVVPMIVMLGCSEIDMEVSDAGMKTADSNDYKEMSRDDRDANGVLVMM